MMTVQASEFFANTAKYIDFDNFKPFAIVNEFGKKIRFTMPKVKEKEEGRMATEEELEMFRRSEENYEKGEYYSMLPDESLDEFLERIESDPEGWLECNLQEKRVYEQVL